LQNHYSFGLWRYSHGARIQASYRSQVESLVTILVWAIATSLSAPPIPFIGVAMWLAFLAALKMIPQERWGYCSGKRP